jgi:hypothetical protein
VAKILQEAKHGCIRRDASFATFVHQRKQRTSCHVYGDFQVASEALGAGDQQTGGGELPPDEFSGHPGNQAAAAPISQYTGAVHTLGLERWTVESSR